MSDTTWIARSANVLARELGGRLVGDGNRPVTGVCPIDEAVSGDLTFAADRRSLALLSQRASAVVLIPEAAVAAAEHVHGCLIVVEDPLATFLSCLRQTRPARVSQPAGIHPTACIDPSVKVGRDVSIGAYTVIEAGCEIGDRCCIYPGVVIGSRCRLGEDCTIYPHAVLYADTSVGRRCIVHAHAVLGADGFGFRFAGGRYEKLDHIGCVELGDDVEIGAGTTIDRAFLGTTRVGTGTKIDNLVMVAHNCRLGEHNILASQVGLAGSVTTGDYARFGGQAGIADHLKIGQGASCAARAGVHRDVPAGETHIGTPAGPESEQRRVLMAMSKLPEMRQRLRQAEHQIEELQAALRLFSGDSLMDPERLAG